MDQETELLKRASNEIKSLRDQNLFMSARLEMFDDMMWLFHTTPKCRNSGMSEDLAWAIDKHITSKAGGDQR